MAETLNLVIDQGEDWTTDLVFTDHYNEPLPIVHPCRMDIKQSDGTLIYTLETDPDLPDGEVPTMAVSTEIGLLQLHIEDTVTAPFPPGEHLYDLFVTVDDGSSTSGPQRIRPLNGKVQIAKRITVM
jgi:hypothetical protein